MTHIVGVRFKRAGRIYYFDPGAHPLDLDELVIVETSKGTELGKVVIPPGDVAESEVTEPLKPVLRKATTEDVERLHSFRSREADALAKCKERVRYFALPMKLIGAEYNFDGSRLVFTFTAEGRVDFRQLVRDLASIFRTRIELRQVGVRDEAKQISGYGRCGRQLCCCAFLDDFSSVSIKMAKEQDLPLNPMKISGLCGRLLCCLGYENKAYCEMRQELPKVGERVGTAQGEGRVVSINILKQLVTVDVGEKGLQELKPSEITRSENSDGGSIDRQKLSKR
ncbi:MAG TPA: stage 0 sporulation family protein [Chloroflexota bacterium]|nr:stage 0 sporulation family protein [Chloroflexota bacterium]